MNLHEFAVKHDLVSTMIEDPTNYFVRVFAILSNLHEDLTKNEEKRSAGVDKAIDEVSKDTDLVDATYLIGIDLREIIFSACETDDRVSILLPKIIDEIRKEVVEVRKIAMSGVTIPDSDEEGNEVDPEDIEEALCAAQILTEQPNTLLAMHGLSFDDLPTKMVDKRKDGTPYVKLPRGFSADALTKRTNGETDNAKVSAGRPVATSSWTFTLNDEKLPTVPLDVLAVRFCSTTVSRVSGSDLREWYENRTGLKFPAPTEEGVITLNVPKGTLVGTYNK